MKNNEIWEKLKRPPKDALKTIRGGRLKGMSDVNPQWRYQAMTDQFGPCGIGWKYEIIKVWSEQGSDCQTFAFAEIALYISDKDRWSDPIPGIGGSMLVTKESNGLYSSDEGYKMAVTDALSVAMKMIGVAADIYAGRWDGSKYKDEPKRDSPVITTDQHTELSDLINETETDIDKFLAHFKSQRLDLLSVDQYAVAKRLLEKKRATANANNSY